MYGSMYGNTEHMADAVAKALQANGVKKVVLHNLSSLTHHTSSQTYSDTKV